MQYFNRYTRRLEEEVIPKEGFIKWLYYTPMGRCFLKNCMCKGVMSKWMGIWMNTRWSRRYILPFVKRYGIDLNDFEKTLGEFSHFNDFFVVSLSRRNGSLMRMMVSYVRLPRDVIWALTRLPNCPNFL